MALCSIVSAVDATSILCICFFYILLKIAAKYASIITIIQEYVIVV